MNSDKVTDLRTLVAEMRDNLMHCTLDSGTCHCGDNMRNHAEPMMCGHSPVDMGWTVADEWLAKAEKALADPADELEATIKTDRVANVRYYYSMEKFAVTLRDGRQGQGSTIRAAIDRATEKEA